MKAAETDETSRLKAEAQKVRTELAEAVVFLAASVRGGSWLSTGGSRLFVRRHAVLPFETRRLGKELAASLNDLRQVFSERPGDAWRFLEKLLDGKLTFHPVETWKGRRYMIEGTATLGGLARLPETIVKACQRDSIGPVRSPRSTGPTDERWPGAH